MDTFKSRLPPREEIIPVYSTIVFCIYGWITIVTLWKIPSWLTRFTLVDIFGFFAYIFSAAFIDSLILFGIILFVSLILPRKFFLSKFIVRSSMLSICLTFWVVISRLLVAVILVKPLAISPLGGLLYASFALSTIILLLYLAGRIGFLEKMLVTLADGFIIFLYLWLPLSFISFIFVIFRNLG